MHCSSHWWWTQKKERDMATIDIPGAFLQTAAKPGNFIRFTEAMVDILCQLNPRLFKEYIVLENGKRVLYTEAHKAVYGMVDSTFFVLV